jgi:hypothetical protein
VVVCEVLHRSGRAGEPEAPDHHVVFHRVEALEAVRIDPELEGVEVDLLDRGGVVEAAGEIGVGPAVVCREDREARPRHRVTPAAGA